MAKETVPISSFTKYNAGNFRLGMKFTAPVFFDDGENMFLAPSQTVKPYHLQAIKQWNIKTLLSRGKLAPNSPATGDDSIPVASAYTETGEIEELEGA
jgi:hypothetical protein